MIISEPAWSRLRADPKDRPGVPGDTWRAEAAGPEGEDAIRAGSREEAGRTGPGCWSSRRAGAESPSRSVPLPLLHLAPLLRPELWACGTSVAKRGRRGPEGRWSRREGRGPWRTRRRTRWGRRGRPWPLSGRPRVAQARPSCKWPASTEACARYAAGPWPWALFRPHSCACSPCAAARASPPGARTAAGSGPSWRPTPSTTATGTRSSNCAGAARPAGGGGERAGPARAAGLPDLRTPECADGVSRLREERALARGRTAA